MTVNLFWDIDGTILKTGGIGFPVMKQAVSEVFNISLDNLDYNLSHGLTDFEVVASLIGKAYVDINSKDILRAINLYEQGVEQVFLKNPPKVLPNIHDVLTYFCNQDFYKLKIGTGNSQNGAIIKLRTSGLIKFFETKSMYCSSPEYWSRDLVMYRAANSLDVESIGIVLGDTPADVSSAHKNNLKVIGLSTGAFSHADLIQAGADVALPNDWEPEDLRKAISLLGHLDKF
jgi:phosphoglycolate phosphatase